MSTYFLAVPTAGISIGSMFGASMMKSGRRLPLILFNIVGMVGCVLSIIDNYAIMILGKFLFGMGAGVLIAVAPRMLEETIPHEIFDKGFGAMTNIGVDTLSLTCTIFMIFLPKKESPKLQKEAIYLYKILYLIPFPMFALSFILNILCFRRETLGFYIHHKDKENSIRCIRQIHMGLNDEEYNEMYDDLIEDDELNYQEPEDFLEAARRSSSMA